MHDFFPSLNLYLAHFFRGNCQKWRFNAWTYTYITYIHTFGRRPNNRRALREVRSRVFNESRSPQFDLDDDDCVSSRPMFILRLTPIKAGWGFNAYNGRVNSIPSYHHPRHWWKKFLRLDIRKHRFCISPAREITPLVIIMSMSIGGWGWIWRAFPAAWGKNSYHARKSKPYLRRRRNSSSSRVEIILLKF